MISIIEYICSQIIEVLIKQGERAAIKIFCKVIHELLCAIYCCLFFSLVVLK